MGWLAQEGQGPRRHRLTICISVAGKLLQSVLDWRSPFEPVHPEISVYGGRTGSLMLAKIFGAYAGTVPRQPQPWREIASLRPSRTDRLPPTWRRDYASTVRILPKSPLRARFLLFGKGFLGDLLLSECNVSVSPLKYEMRQKAIRLPDGRPKIPPRQPNLNVCEKAKMQVSNKEIHDCAYCLLRERRPALAVPRVCFAGKN
jgi:hypothetical protein